MIVARHLTTAALSPGARRLATVALAFGMALALAGCALGPTMATSTPTPAVPGPLVAITLRGGLCANGTCESTVTLSADGVVRVAAKPPNALGTVPADRVAALAALVVVADFATVRSHPFFGHCPTAVDGQEVVVTFWVGGRQEVVAGCTTAIDWASPLFAAVAGALGPFATLPTP